MHARTATLRGFPAPVANALAALAAVGNSLAWAFAMRRECERWTRSGRRLDGAAIQQIADRLRN